MSEKREQQQMIQNTMVSQKDRDHTNPMWRKKERGEQLEREEKEVTKPWEISSLSNLTRNRTLKSFKGRKNWNACNSTACSSGK